MNPTLLGAEGGGCNRPADFKTLASAADQRSYKGPSESFKNFLVTCV